MAATVLDRRRDRAAGSGDGRVDFDDAPPADLDAPRDLLAIGLAAVGCAAGFIGAAQLTSHGFTDAAVTVPLFGGLALIVVLIVYQFRARRPLLTIRTMLTSSIPVAGVGVALFAAAASVAATALTANVLLQTYSPVHVGLLYLPELGGAVVMAFVFGIVITRRRCTTSAGRHGVARGRDRGVPDRPSANQPLVLLGSALTGLALGATVAPALFVAGSHCSRRACSGSSRSSSSCGRWPRSWSRRSSRISR